jgi:hypothetical protein
MLPICSYYHAENAENGARQWCEDHHWDDRDMRWK